MLANPDMDNFGLEIAETIDQLESSVPVAVQRHKIAAQLRERCEPYEADIRELYLLALSEEIKYPGLMFPGESFIGHFRSTAQHIPQTICASIGQYLWKRYPGFMDRCEGRSLLRKAHRALRDYKNYIKVYTKLQQNSSSLSLKDRAQQKLYDLCLSLHAAKMKPYLLSRDELRLGLYVPIRFSI